jgi:serine/threonine-protein kinase RsbW
MSTSHARILLVAGPERAPLGSGWQVQYLSTIEEVTPVVESVVAAMTGLAYGEKDVFGARLALEEAVCNAIKHGHQFDPTRVVEVRHWIGPDQLLVEVEDQGPGFDPLQVPDATAPENLERACGRGLLLIRHYAAWMSHNPVGNCVTFCICRSA